MVDRLPILDAAMFIYPHHSGYDVTSPNAQPATLRAINKAPNAINPCRIAASTLRAVKSNVRAMKQVASIQNLLRPFNSANCC